ncbi:hypothetical protein ACNHYB_05285 [Isoptericola jiangsuensis]|uniref:hypothetical protein n=1 Tax=Isoptericola jiangsuensis TaxID=548579 RepID=UPI003AB07974
MRQRPRTDLPAHLLLLVALTLGGCSSPADGGTSGGSSAVQVGGPSPEAVPATTPEQAVLDFFAAYDQVVFTGDTSHWTELSSPDCTYCLEVADAARVYAVVLGAQGRDSDVLVERGYTGFEVTILSSSGPTEDDRDTATVDVEMELVLSDGVGGTDLDTGGLRRARVFMARTDGRWIVQDVTAVPATEAGSGSGAGGDATSADVDEVDAAAALEDYLERERQVAVTGDTTAVEEMTDPECAACRDRVRLAQDAVAAGMELSGGECTVALERRIPTADVLGPPGPGKRPFTSSSSSS